MNFPKYAVMLLLTACSLSGLAVSAATWNGQSPLASGTPWTIEIISSDASSTHLTLECPGFWTEPVLQNGETRTRVILPNSGVTTATGLPELPVLNRFFKTPDNRDAEVIIHAVTTLSFPCQNLYVAEPIDPDKPELYAQVPPKGDLYPASWSKAQPAGIMKDHRLAPVLFYPVRYDIAKSELLLATRLEVEIRYTKPATTNLKTQHTRASEAFTPLYQATLDNLSAYNTATPLYGEGSRGKYMIVVDGMYRLNVYLEQFVTWKKQLGYKVIVDSLQQIGTTRDQIKAAITEEYFKGDAPLDYVLLIGDESGSGAIPAYTATKPGGSEIDVTDHTYSLMEGQDYFSDVMVGRISVRSDIELSTALKKVLTYQKTPYMTDPSWFKEALVVAGNYSDQGQTPITPVWTSLWLVDKLWTHGYDPIDTVLYWGPGYPSPDPSQITSIINGGVSLIAYRGWADADGWQNPQYKRNNISELTNGQRLPIVASIVCNTGDFGNTNYEPCFGEYWLRVGLPNSLKGGAAFYGPSDLHTNTKWNNALYAGFFEGMLEENLYRLSQAVLRSKLELYYGFPENTGIGDYAEFYFYVYNILGDPELPMWSDIPAQISIQAPAQLQPGIQMVTATLKKADNSPLGGAYVSFYQSGEVLNGGVSAGDGTITLEITPVDNSNITITASKQNYYPKQQAITVQLGDLPLGIESLAISGDGIANAGETVNLTVAVKNFGSSAVSGVTAQLSESNPYIAITQASSNLGIIAPASIANALFSFSVAASCPQNHVADFTLDLSDGSHQSEIKFILPLSGWQFYPAGYSFLSGSLSPGSQAQMYLNVHNGGNLTAQSITGVLTCADGAVTFQNEQSSYPVMVPGATAQNTQVFSLQVNSSAAVGRQVILELTLSLTNGYSQKLSYPVQLGQPTTTDPLGPDSYGYYAYDNTDVEYTPAPTYSWIELDSAFGGKFDTHYALGDDSSTVIHLPFPFKFYGVEYDSLTICSNGWISLLPTWMAEFRNWNFPSALGPPTMIAPFWDDLKVDTTISTAIDVYSRYDAVQGQFIIEWSHTVNRYGYETPSTWKIETFEVMLLDPVSHPTPTGDGEMIFQYQEVHDVDDNNNYATVGIEDEGHLRGLQYTYSNDLAPSSAPLDSGRAIKITTVPPDSYGKLDAGATGELATLQLHTPLPNPANPTTTLAFYLPSSGRVRLELYDTLGRRTLLLGDNELTQGEHRTSLNGSKLSSGIYFVLLRFDGVTRMQKVLILK